MVRSHPLNPAPAILVDGAMPVLEPELEREVQALWQAELARRAVVNGQIFTITQLSPSRIIGHFTEYRRLIAQRRRPELFPLLHIRPLAVSGLLHIPDGIVFGRRSLATTQDGGLWELVPSGGIDLRAAKNGRVDARRQILDELAEEIGITATAEPPFCLLEDEETGVFDLGIALRSECSTAQMRTALASASGEYTELVVVPPHRLTERIEHWGCALVAISRRLLEEKGLAG